MGQRFLCFFSQTIVPEYSRCISCTQTSETGTSSLSSVQVGFCAVQVGIQTCRPSVGDHTTCGAQTQFTLPCFSSNKGETLDGEKDSNRWRYRNGNEDSIKAVRKYGKWLMASNKPALFFNAIASLSSWQNAQVVRSPTSGVPPGTPPLPFRPLGWSWFANSHPRKAQLLGPGRLEGCRYACWRTTHALGWQPGEWEKNKSRHPTTHPQMICLSKACDFLFLANSNSCELRFVVLEKTMDLPIESKCNARYPKFQMHVSSF